MCYGRVKMLLLLLLLKHSAFNMLWLTLDIYGKSMLIEWIAWNSTHSNTNLNLPYWFCRMELIQYLPSDFTVENSHIHESKRGREKNKDEHFGWFQFQYSCTIDRFYGFLYCHIILAAMLLNGHACNRYQLDITSRMMCQNSNPDANINNGVEMFYSILLMLLFLRLLIAQSV